MPPKPKKNSSPPYSPSYSRKKMKQEKKPNEKNKSPNSTPILDNGKSPSPLNSRNNSPCNPLHFPDSVKNPGAKTPPKRHKQLPKTLPHGLNKLTKTTPNRHENVQGHVVDKDVDGKSVPHGPTRTNVLEKKVDNNELANPQLDEEKNSCLVPDKLKGCHPNNLLLDSKIM